MGKIEEYTDKIKNARYARDVRSAIVGGIKQCYQDSNGGFFKGTVNLISDLPTTNNVVNDTYYVKDVKARYSWNGTEWTQSGMSEAQYTQEFEILKDTMPKGDRENINCSLWEAGTNSIILLWIDGLLNKLNYGNTLYINEDMSTLTCNIDFTKPITVELAYDEEDITDTITIPVSNISNSLKQVGTITNHAELIGLKIFKGENDQYYITNDRVVDYAGKQISELKEDLANKVKLINIVGKLTKGGYPNPFNNGNIEPHEDYYYTDFIPTNPRSSSSFIANNVAFLCYYDQNKNYMPSPNPTIYTNEDLNIPTSVYYIRVGTSGDFSNSYIFNCSIDDYNNYVDKYNMQYITSEFIPKSKLTEDFNIRNVSEIHHTDFYYNIEYSATIKVIEVAESGYNTIEPLLLKAGTYTYNNILGYFSILGDDLNATNPTRLSVETSNTSGTFTLTSDKYLWITVNDAYLNTFELNVNLTKVEILKYYIYSKTHNIIRCGSTREYTTLKSAIEEAVKTKGTIIYVDEGTYDLINEFGNDYFDNLDGSSEKAGLQIYNDIHIIFNPNSKVLCNYNGLNSNVNRFFSPFNSGDDTKSGGFILENLNIICSNVRYCVHDEHVNDRVPYTQKYINCNMKIDNTNNEYWDSSQCIGGGLGGYGNIEIKDSIFSSILTGGSTDTVAVSYHNTRYISDAKSKIIISNCYFKNNNTVGAFSYGDTNEFTEFIISNNSIGKEISEITYDGFHKNIDVFDWNNVIRSN